MDHSIFSGLDLWVVYYASGMAFVTSGLTTWRARNAQRLKGLPLSSWLTAIPDTLAGMLIGTALGVFVPPHVASLDNLSGVTVLCGGGGILGPKLWDLISNRGLSAALSLLPGPLAPLAKALAAQNKDGDSDGSSQTPPKPPL
ncbi:hypothetical protein Q0M94_28595 (plasmid) [Deinococcus radiomollis]|uniref:hypothetical protein n=1 Tax=Deinococcus radiomollis TaxID=468916 RepID=UPI0038925244